MHERISSWGSHHERKDYVYSLKGDVATLNVDTTMMAYTSGVMVTLAACSKVSLGTMHDHDAGIRPPGRIVGGHSHRQCACCRRQRGCDPGKRRARD